jgi:lipoprotein-anchoring transpeptidase ErfK/SrfK
VRRSSRFLATALPVALATVPVALAGADPASGGPEPVDPAAMAMPSQSSRVAASAATRSAGAAAEAAQPRPSLIARVAPGATIALRSRPHGTVALRADDTSPFGSPQRLGVVRRHGRWLGVTTPELPNGALGWIDRRSAAVRVERTRWAIHADISSRTIVLRRAGKLVKRLRVAVGRPGSPTPTGRFAVTDKLSGGGYGPYYGCCILAISATQPNTPPGWTGGNRMAIHGTSDPSSIGAAASAGCLRATDSDLAFLMSRVPVGAPVVIRR